MFEMFLQDLWYTVCSLNSSKNQMAISKNYTRQVNELNETNRHYSQVQNGLSNGNVHVEYEMIAMQQASL